MILGAMLAASFIFFVQSSPIKYSCVKSPALMHWLAQQHLAYTAIFIDLQGRTFALYTKPSTREWLIIGIDNDLNSCVVAQGSNWQWAIE